MGQISDTPEYAARIAPRFQFDARIRIGIHRNGELRFVGGWARDLSESGVGAFVAEPMQEQEEVVLELPIAGQKMTIPAKILRVLGTQYGFQFTALSQSQRKIIREYAAGQKPLSLNSAATILSPE